MLRSLNPPETIGFMLNSFIWGLGGVGKEGDLELSGTTASPRGWCRLWTLHADSECQSGRIENLHLPAPAPFLLRWWWLSPHGWCRLRTLDTNSECQSGLIKSAAQGKVAELQRAVHSDPLLRLKNLHCSFSQRCFPSLLDTNKKASRPREETWRSVSWDWLALHSMFGTGKSFQLVLRGQIPHRKPSPKLQEDEAQTKHISRPRCLAWVLAQPYPLVRG